MEPEPSQRCPARGWEAIGTHEILARFQDKISQWGGQWPGSHRRCAISILVDILNSARQGLSTSVCPPVGKGLGLAPEVLSNWSYSAVLWLQLKFHQTQLNPVLSGATIENPRDRPPQKSEAFKQQKKYCKPFLLQVFVFCFHKLLKVQLCKLSLLCWYS